MAFDLNIYFTGLCVFVPRGNGSRMDVLLVDTGESRQNGVELKEHVGVVQYAIRNRKSDLPNYPLFQDSEGAIKGLWFLDHENLSLKNEGNFYPNTLDVGFEKVTDYPKDEVDAGSFHWIAPLCDEAGETYKVDLKRLDDGVKNSGAKILARLQLSAGSLRPACFSVDPVTNKFFIWEFEAHRQAVASVVLLKLRVDSDEVCLVAEKFDKQDSRWKRYLCLGPDPESEKVGISEPVEIWIMNRERAAICNQSAPGPKEFGLGNEEKEFEYFRNAFAKLPGNQAGGKNPIPNFIEGCAGDLKLPGCNDNAMKKIYFPLCAGEKWPSGNCPPTRAEDASTEIKMQPHLPPHEKAKTLAQLHSSYRGVLKLLKDHKSVAAIDIGAKDLYDDTLALAVRVHTTQPLTADEKEKVAKFGPLFIDPIPDQDVTYSKKNTGDNQNQDNMIQPGSSIGRKDRSAGTLGALVLDRTTKQLGVLSCWHVLAHSRANDGDRILQPGVSDGGHIHKDWIASLASLERLPRPDQDGDAAFAILKQPIEKTLELKQRELNVMVEATRELSLSDIGLTVTKSGRATGVTKGRIDGIGTYFVTFEDNIGRVGVEGFMIKPLTQPNKDHDEEISLPGDSGAIWVLENEKTVGVGLHFEGEKNENPLAEHAIACHLTRVMERLNLELVKNVNMGAKAGRNAA